MNPDRKPLGLVVCMPTRGALSIETMLRLREQTDGYPNRLLTAFRKPVVEARNQLAREARELDPNSLDFDARYALWVDDDAWWPTGAVAQAVETLERHPEVDILTALFSNRKPDHDGNAFSLNYTRKIAPISIKPDELVPVGATGMHWVIMRRELLIRLGDGPFNLRKVKHPSEKPLSWGDGDIAEDFSFCLTAREAGAKIAAARILVGHVDATLGLCYFPNCPPYDRQRSRASAVERCRAKALDDRCAPQLRRTRSSGYALR